MNYKETEYLTLDGEWINFNVPQDEYDKKQRDSHFGVVNLYKENVEKIQKDYIEKIVKTISDNYRELKTESKTKKKPNLQISFTFGDNVYCITNNDIYRQDLKKRNSNKKRKEILDKNGKWEEDNNTKIDRIDFYGDVRMYFLQMLFKIFLEDL